MRAATSDYGAWKGWEDFFTFDARDGAYFDGQCRDLAIAGADVLEIGFGRGNFLAWAQDRGAGQIAGTEILPEALQAAEARGIETLPADLESVAAKHEARFDTAVAFDVFEHLTWPEIESRLRALEVMIRPSGHLLLRFPNASSPFGLALQHGDPTHVPALSGQALGLVVQGTAFEVVHDGPEHRVRGPDPLRSMAAGARYLLRDALGACLNRLYGLSIDHDPVSVVVLQRCPDDRAVTRSS